jgi:hypothetical protein
VLSGHGNVLFMDEALVLRDAIALIQRLSDPISMIGKRECVRICALVTVRFLWFVDQGFSRWDILLIVGCFIRLRSLSARTAVADCRGIPVG